MFGPSRFFPPVLWPLLTSCSSLLLRIFFRICLPNASARPPRVLTHSFPLYLSHLLQAIRAAIGLRFVRQTYPCLQPYMRFLFVRPEVCPVEDLLTSTIRLSSDSASRRTPLLLTNLSRCRAGTGLSPARMCAHRAHRIHCLRHRIAGGDFYGNCRHQHTHYSRQL